MSTGIDQHFWHDEQRDAARTGHQLAVRAWNLGQNEVDDVVGEFVLTRGNPHLAAEQAVTGTQYVGLEISAIGHGTGGDVRQAGARLRFGQAHRPCPATIELGMGKDLLLPGRAMCHEQIGVAHGEHSRTDTDRGLGEKCIGRGFHCVRQLHTADGLILRCGQHARVSVGAPSRVRGLWQDDAVAALAWLLGIHQPVKRRVFVAGDALAGVKHLGKSICVVLFIARPGAQAGHVEPVMK